MRLNNVSQLAAFSKRDDLAYFLRRSAARSIATSRDRPPPRSVDAYKKRKGSWDAYAEQFLALLTERRIEDVITPAHFAVPTVLLCSEPTAEHCHRRLVLEYLQEKWGDVEVTHL